MASFGGKSLPLINLLKLKSTPILQQLHLEQRLLRGSSENWCIINNGMNPPNIVMGSSGNPSDLLELKSVLHNRIPVIRRFSGGGTVIVDEGTIFITFICNKDAIPGLKPHINQIYSWCAQLYSDALKGFGGFRLRENDYVYGDLKFGGNAQSIIKSRWLHHTSFLWDFDIKNMEYLKIPTRAPNYRLARNHGDFLCSMKNYLPSRSTFIDNIISALDARFIVTPVQMEMIDNLPTVELQNSTKLLTVEELEEVFAPQPEICILR